MQPIARSFQIHSELELEALAKKISSEIPAGSSIGLIGDLGAGKTTFVRYICKALQSTTPVSSPTYVLQHEYLIPTGVIEHWDFYRLSELPGEIFEPVKEGSYRFIEWIDKLDPKRSLVNTTIRLELLNDGSRKLSLLPTIL